MNGLIYLNLTVWTRLAGEDEDGQGLVEYGLILGLIAMMLVGALSLLGQQLDTTFHAIANSIP
jgi:pilus assembly protein Flp/PilA